MRARLVTLILAAGVSLGGCAYGGGFGGLSVGTSYGSPYGYGDGYGSPYGYGSQYGSPYGYAGYGSPYGYGGGYGGGYGYDPFNRYNPYYRSGYYGSPFGWYDGFYYPGTGHYVYDRERKRRPLTEQLRKIWMQRAAEAAAATARNGQASGSAGTRSTARIAPNWSEFNREGEARASRARGGLATQVGTRARQQARPDESRTTTRTTESRATPRATTRTERSQSTSKGLGSTIRRRINASDD